MTEDEGDDEFDVEIAKAIHSVGCSSCNKVHITMIDFGDIPFARVDLAPEAAAAFASRILNHANSVMLQRTGVGHGRNKLH